jgi:hypothetical protein
MVIFRYGDRLGVYLEMSCGVPIQRTAQLAGTARGLAASTGMESRSFVGTSANGMAVVG